MSDNDLMPPEWLERIRANATPPRKPPAAKPRRRRVNIRNLEARLLDLDHFDTLEDVRDFLATTKRRGG